jgi:hypothetical protein
VVGACNYLISSVPVKLNKFFQGTGSKKGLFAKIATNFPFKNRNFSRKLLNCKQVNSVAKTANQGCMNAKFNYEWPYGDGNLALRKNTGYEKNNNKPRDTPFYR